MIRPGRKRLWRDHGSRLLRVVENLADDFNDAVEECDWRTRRIPYSAHRLGV